MSVVSWEYKL